MPAPGDGRIVGPARESCEPTWPRTLQQNLQDRRQSNDTPFNADDTLVSVESPGKRWFMASGVRRCAAVYASYLTYRAVFTINQDAIVFSLLVYFAELHGFVALFLYFHQLWHLRKRQVVPPTSGLKVDVYVTTYNEDVDLLRQTLRAAVADALPARDLCAR
jgi:hypothetical protein